MKKNKFIQDLVINFYEKFVLPYVAKKSTKIICSSDFVRKSMFSNQSKNIITISPGVDTTFYKPNNQIKPKNKVLYIGSIDRSTEWKGIIYLLNAIKIVKKHVPNILLTLVGEGNQINEYKTYAEINGLKKNVQFVGKKIAQNKINVINTNNILILPSTTDAESFGIVLIEAMACKKPVIGTNIGGIKSVIDDNINGLLVSARDAEGLNKSIRFVHVDLV
jgi:glycosyltransferase involved in cell wall biosynthesis